jgi:hypothetical protein
VQIARIRLMNVFTGMLMLLADSFRYLNDFGLVRLSRLGHDVSWVKA